MPPTLHGVLETALYVDDVERAAEFSERSGDPELVLRLSLRTVSDSRTAEGYQRPKN